MISFLKVLNIFGNNCQYILSVFYIFEKYTQIFILFRRSCVVFLFLFFKVLFIIKVEHHYFFLNIFCFKSIFIRNIIFILKFKNVKNIYYFFVLIFIFWIKVEFLLYFNFIYVKNSYFGHFCIMILNFMHLKKCQAKILLMWYDF